MSISTSDRGRVLIVDDDRRMLDLLVDLLEVEGYEVSTALNGAEALDLAATFDPDVVVSDVVMPVLGGLELCRRLKDHARTAYIPVLLVSGLIPADDGGIEGLYAGADDYLDLPFRNEELLVKVARLVERHRIQKHYRGIVEQAADIIYTRDMEGYITSINDAGARFYGRTSAEMIGRHLSEIIDAESATRDIEQARSHNGNLPIRSTYHVRDARGVARCLDGMITVERDRHGCPIGVRVVVRDITDQKKAEEALKESEERYRRLVELSPDAIVVHREGKFIYVNPAAVRLWGATGPSDLIGQSILKVVHPDFHDHVRERVDYIQKFRAPTDLAEQKCLRLDGTEIYVEVTGLPFTSEGKSAVLAVFRDITEKKQAREALRKAEKRLRTVVASASLILFATDKNGIFTLCEGEGLKSLSLQPGELVGQSAYEVYADSPQVGENIRRALKGEAFTSSVAVRELVFEVRYSPLTDERENVLGVIGVATDITENRRAEASIRESEERYRELFENANDIIYTHDLQGNFTSLNRTCERITGYSREEATKMNVADVIAPEYLNLAREMIARKASEKVSTFYEIDIISKSGRRVRLEVSTRLIFRDGKPVGVQGIARDLTERKHSEEALRESQAFLAQQAQREAMTHRISQAIRCSLDPLEIYKTAVKELGSYLKVDRCSLFMKDNRRKCVTNVAEYHADGVEPAATDFSITHLQYLIAGLDKSGVLPFSDAVNDPRITDLYEKILSKANVKSIMYVAITVADDFPAAFALSTTKRVREWSEADIALAKAVADQTGIAIRQAALYQQAETTSIRESLVNRITMAIRASLSLPEVLSTATRELGLALSASRVQLCLYHSEGGSETLEYEYLAPGIESVKNSVVNCDDPIGCCLSDSGQPLIIDDTVNYEGTSPALRDYVRDRADRFGIGSQINYPLFIKGQFRGSLCIYQNDRKRVWTEDELSLVEALAERVAIGIAQAELFEMVARGKTEWETTFDAMSDGIFIFDRSGELKRVNRAGAAMEALHPKLLLGKNCCDILRTSEEDETCVVERALETGRSVTIEITPTRLNRPLLVTIEPVVDENEKPQGVVCTARDLSDLRKVQAVAREHQSLLTNILESARESIYAVDPDGNFKWCNTATLKGLGYQRSNFIGRPLLAMVYEADRELVREKLDAALTGAPQTYEMRYFAHDGQLRYARVDNSPLVVEGRTTGVLGIARDITEQKEERERAARADKLRALGQLASGVAHDFNNSLAAILGRAQLLRRQVNDPALVRNLDIIQTAAEDAAATVRRIQTFARKSAVKEFDLVDVAGLLNDAVEITRTRWQNEARVRGLEYDVKLNTEPGQHTYGSASELREVFVNLIVNAVDAMPKGGKLLITCRRVDDRLQLHFSDNGMGMPEDVQQKIFEPFFSTKGAHGTGLGLSVSYSIIERHAGSISVVSEPRKGTNFTIDLPAVVAETASDYRPGTVRDAPSLRILVVDDEEPVRETLAEMLVAVNHEVELAGSGYEAVQKMRAGGFDFVFTDLAMPEMDGWETARMIRKDFPGVRIVLVTGYGPTTAPPAGEEDLVDAIIGKPFDFAQVGSTLNALSGCLKSPESRLDEVSTVTR
ncbi:MAG TPA: PAS domain S-box protein [Pyrinomonadaceae bacterium]|nr:PAS domain S-box protein [Pyrinomonadaceae bacterium]